MKIVFRGETYIDISAFRYNDNKPTIHLIEKKPQCILWSLFTVVYIL